MRTPADVSLLSVVTDALIDGGLVSKDIIIKKKKKIQQQHKNEQEKRYQRNSSPIKKN